MIQDLVKKTGSIRRMGLSVSLYLFFGALCVSFLLILLPPSLPLAIFLLATGTQAVLTTSHAEKVLGPRRLFLLMGITLFLTFLTEAIGVRLGLPFGPYHYTSILGPQIAAVPVVIPIAWFTMLYPSWLLARLLWGRRHTSRSGTFFRVIVGALLMVGWDLVLDPAMSTGFSCWVWEGNGWFQGVPLVNFLAWWGLSAVVLLLFELLSGTQPGRLPMTWERPEGLPFFFYLANVLFATVLCFHIGLVTAGFTGLFVTALVTAAIFTRWRPRERGRPGGSPETINTRPDAWEITQ